MYVYKANDIHAIDRRAVEQGFSIFTLMENAGRSLAEAIMPSLKKTDRILILAGRGNNGGDGIVLARYLQQEGYSVSLSFPLGDPKTEAAKKHLLFYEAQGYQTTEWNQFVTYDVIVDALLGIGTTLPLRENIIDIIQWCNEQDALRIAVDMPTGVLADSGVIEEHGAFLADYTFSLHGFKHSAFLLPSSTYYGACRALSIGIKQTGNVKLITEEEVKTSLPKRKKEAHKGTFGTSLIVAGTDEMPGSALLSAIGAIKTGTGKLVIATTPYVASSLATAVPEATYMLQGLERLSEGECPDKVAAIGIGPGLTDVSLIQRTIDSLRLTDIPLVLDAGALIPQTSWKRKGKTILTPHPGEFSRLTGLSVEEIQANRIEIASQYAVQNGVIVVLKGHFTVIAFPDGYVLLNPTGNDALGKGGSGDVLTGMITSMIATHDSVKDAVKNAVYIHGLCADIWVKENSSRSMTASDFRTLLPIVLKRLEIS